MKKGLYFILLAIIATSGAGYFIFKNKSERKSFAEKRVQKVAFPISFFANPDFSFVYTAKAKGYFAEEGLEVDIVENKGSAVTSQLIGSGQYPIGVVSGDYAMIARSKGVPLKIVSVIEKMNPAMIVCHRSSNVHTPQDLYGKTLGVNLPGTPYKQYLVFASKENLDRSQIKEVPISPSDAEFIGKQVDCEVSYRNLLARATVMEIPVDYILFYDYDMPMYGLTIAANTEALKSDPDLIRRINRALVKGLAYEKNASIEEIMDFFFKENPKALADKDFYTANYAVKRQLEKSVPGEIDQFDGIISRESLTRQKELLGSLGFLDSDFNLQDFYTNDFLK